MIPAVTDRSQTTAEGKSGSHLSSGYPCPPQSRVQGSLWLLIVVAAGTPLVYYLGRTQGGSVSACSLVSAWRMLSLCALAWLDLQSACFDCAVTTRCMMTSHMNSTCTSLPMAILDDTRPSARLVANYRLFRGGGKRATRRRAHHVHKHSLGANTTSSTKAHS